MIDEEKAGQHALNEQNIREAIDEILRVMIRREIAIMYRGGLAPKPPEAARYMIAGDQKLFAKARRKTDRKVD